MKDREREYKEGMRAYHDKSRHAKQIELKVGDQVLQSTSISIQSRASYRS